jgi:small subunit ribosomal protein S20
VANHKDALKRIKQNDKRRIRNRAYRSRMRNQIKALRSAVDAGDVDDAQAKLRTTVSIIQKLASKGVIHPNQAARRVQRLHKAVKGMSA